MAINKISGNILADNLVRGSALAFQTDLLYLDVITGNVAINTTTATHTLTVNGNCNILGPLEVTGNISGGNLLTGGDISAGGNITANNFSGTGNISLGNLSISNTTITTTLGTGNITLAPTGNAVAIIDTVSGLVLPVGDTAQRPSPVSTGTLRFNTDSDRLEIYDGTGWEDVVANVTNQTLTGNGVQTVFTLDRDSSTAGTLVIINGLVQLPITAYSIAGNSLTFTQAPTVSDTIDIRFL